MQEITLRPHQVTAVADIWNDLSNGFNALLQAPCSAGKSIMLAMIAKRLIEEVPGARILVLLDREVLARQIHSTFKQIVPAEIGMCCASVDKNKDIENFRGSK